MPINDLVCDSCGLVVPDKFFHKWPSQIEHIVAEGSTLKRCGPFKVVLGASSRFAQVSEKERAVVWYHPQHGYRYPGRNDAVMPTAYARAGFVRKEFPHLSDIQHHERETGTVNEINHFDRGSGRDFFGD